jgi:hypothetical protein
VETWQELARLGSDSVSGLRVNQELRRFRCPPQILAQLFESDVIAQLWPDRQDLFGDDAVGPFDQRNENGRTAELCIPIRKIVFRDPTGPGTSSSSKDGNVFGDDLLA